MLDGLLSAIRRGESQSLVLRGEAGIGKTALLEYLLESASDLAVLRAVGVESEMELAYASLHQLCAPLLDRLERLPAPQRDALRVVFGLSTGPVPDRFLVGLAVLSVLSDTAEQRPLLCVVDDAQWLDQASALTLAFVARRLLAEPVGIVFAAREPGRELQDLPELEVHGVRNGDARALLGSAVRLKLDERVRDRIIAETRGNPLALLELPRGLTAPQLAGGFGLLEAQGLPARIEESFVRRLNALPDDARRLLLLAAAEPVGDPLLLLRASEQLGIAVAAVDAETDGLLTIGERATFRHPLVRSAVYRSAAVQERRAVHLALAEATDRNVDPDRHAWHLAAGAAGPDEQVASELERSAGRAQARGGVAATAAFLQRAVALTEDSARRADRALAAAQASFQAGAFDAALGLLATAGAGPLDELGQAHVERMRAQIAFDQRRGRDASPLLLRAAQRLEPLDVELARETHLEALVAAIYASCFAAGADVTDVAVAARSAPLGPDPLPASQLLLLGLATRLTDGCAAAAPILSKAVQAYRAEERRLDRLCLAFNIAAEELWDDEAWLELASSQVELARETGTLLLLPYALDYLAGVHTQAGELSVAEGLLTEAEGLELGVRPEFPLRLAAWRGQASAALALFEVMTSGARARGEGCAIAAAEYDLAVLYNGLGQYELALDAAQNACASDDIVTSSWALYELAEAASRCGRPDIARYAVDRLSERATASGTPWAMGCEARSRALVEDGETAEDLYRQAIQWLAPSRMAFYLARARLNYGEWLRREKRRVDARAQLRYAHDMFTSMGAVGFGDRARTELLATGETVRKRTVETRDELTAQERQIAQLARDGLSNPEIGARLFLSPRTVEWHLRKVFAKLGIHSRRELADALPSSDSKLVRA